jgi:hypothetical protein
MSMKPTIGFLLFLSSSTATAPASATRPAACQAARASVAAHCGRVVAREAFDVCDPLPGKEMMACHAVFERLAEGIKKACAPLIEETNAICTH